MNGKKTVNNTKIKSAKPNRHWWQTALIIIGLMLWVGASIVVSQLVVGYLMLWILGSDTFMQPVCTAIYSALSYILAMCLIIFIPPAVSMKWKERHIKSPSQIVDKKLKDNISREKLGLKNWPTWTDIGLSIAGLIVYLLIAAVLMALFSIFPWFNAEEAQDVGFSTYISGFDRIIAFITLVVVAPIAEEIIFRGWLYSKLKNKLTDSCTEIISIIIASLLVSLVFGIIHLQWNVGVNVFAMSLVLCALREITGTIYAGILLHMLKNGIAFYLLYVVGS